MPPTSLSTPTRRELLAATAAAGAMTMLAGTRIAQANGDGLIPFSVNFPEDQLDDLRRRVVATRWPDRETVADDTQGVQLATIQKLAKHWATDYDWRKMEARLNALPQFITEIDGLDIHFIHVRSQHKNALPLIVTHGWPGSVIEQLKIIEPLTDPTAHGGSEEDAFDVVIPSLPGYGFSGKPTGSGNWNPPRIAHAWVTLMQRLGYTKFVAQGGDWGNAVTELMAVQEPPGLLGIHTNMAATVPADIAKALAASRPVAGRKARLRSARRFLQEWAGLCHRDEQPAADALRHRRLAGRACVVDARSRHPQLPANRPRFRRRARGADQGRYPRQRHALLADEPAISSARLYWDNAHHPSGGFFDPRGIKIPVAVSAFPDEIYQAPQSWAEKAYPKLIHYNRLPKGGHFAAWEQPMAFTAELRTAFRPLRQ